MMRAFFMPFSIFDVSSEKKRAKACALLGPYKVFIDHTAPLCALLDIPLITDQPQVKLSYESLYPGLQIKIKKWDLRYLLENYENVFYAFRPHISFAKSVEKAALKEPCNPIWKNKTRFIYHLHGCSDKGYHSSWIAPNSHFLDMDQILFYGPRMRDIFRDNGVLERMRDHLLVGNYRLSYFQKHQKFFQEAVETAVFSHFEKDQPTLLYAPSWTDPEGSCSLFDSYRVVLDQLPSHYNLILKLHPYLSIKTPEYDPKPLYEKLEPYAHKPNIQIVPLFPLIYPLLSRCSAYIGDFSSVGYDALSFDLPLFFINHQKRSLKDKGAYLLRCGEVLDLESLPTLYSRIDKALQKPDDPFYEVKAKTYEYAFGEKKPYEEVEKSLREKLLNY